MINTFVGFLDIIHGPWIFIQNNYEDWISSSSKHPNHVKSHYRTSLHLRTPQSKSQVSSRLTVSQSVFLDIEHPFETCVKILLPVEMLLSEICGLVSMWRTLWREDGSVICSVITQWSVSLTICIHTLLSNLRLLQPGEQVPVFIPPRNRVAQLYPWHCVTPQSTQRMIHKTNTTWTICGSLDTQFKAPHTRGHLSMAMYTDMIKVLNSQSLKNRAKFKRYVNSKR
jgi:hypothetical protein